VERISGRIAAKLIPEAEGDNRLMGSPLMLPAALLSKAMKLAGLDGRTLDAFVATILAQRVKAMAAETSAQPMAAPLSGNSLCQPGTVLT
jgi:hypothetical protein